MEHMEDKDFDQLFKGHFEEAEVAPSTNLWSNIEKELAPKKRVVLPAYWMAAAVLLIGVMVAVLMPKSEPIRLQGSTVDNLASSQNTDVVNSGPAEETVVEEQQEESTPLVIAPKLNEAQVRKDFASEQPVVERTHPVDKEVQNTPAVLADVQPETPANEVMMARVEAPQEAIASVELEQTEHRGIRNVGDLINIVVNKVDKRDKKLIQFNTDEDDNSSVVAINIGFLRFNKRDK
jgi:type II secretory pathway component PulM